MSAPPAKPWTNLPPSAHRGGLLGQDLVVEMSLGASFPCRSCRSRDTHLVLDLGLVPASDAFPLASDPEPDARFPLELYRCGQCSLLQLGPATVLAPEPDRPRLGHRAGSCRAVIRNPVVGMAMNVLRGRLP